MCRSCYTYADTPVGRLFLACRGEALVVLTFAAGKRAFGPRPDWRADDGPFVEITRQLNGYFEGRRRAFDFPVGPVGTPFERAVWREVTAIPYGTTASYADIARRIGRPRACRAVGAANGKNPISIVIPCHRVIASSGTLAGYGGGLQIKRMLLELEKRVSATGPPASDCLRLDERDPLQL
jgi:methylated-DNA-[protein]-cysteine S-methyltransferase